jgi:hypothetical protein
MVASEVMSKWLSAFGGGGHAHDETQDVVG